MITENLSTLKIHKLTQAQYDRELAAGNIDENAFYITPDASSEQVDEKQSKITGTPGQFVVIGNDGNVTTVSLTNVAEVGA